MVTALEGTSSALLHCWRSEGGGSPRSASVASPTCPEDATTALSDVCVSHLWSCLTSPISLPLCRTLSSYVNVNPSLCCRLILSPLLHRITPLLENPTASLALYSSFPVHSYFFQIATVSPHLFSTAPTYSSSQDFKAYENSAKSTALRGHSSSIGDRLPISYTATIYVILSGKSIVELLG